MSMAISRPAGRYHARLGPPFSEKRFPKCRERLTDGNRTIDARSRLKSTVFPPRTTFRGHVAHPIIRKSLSDREGARQPHEQGFPSGWRWRGYGRLSRGARDLRLASHFSVDAGAIRQRGYYKNASVICLISAM
jgi:hypothetical protein